MKKCKYCKTKIDDEATVCPNCRKAQSDNNNPILWIPICGIIFFFIYCVFSNNAPVKIKYALCSLGIRSGDYCLVSRAEYLEATDEHNSCYISYDKYNSIKEKMTYEEVKNIIGCDGELRGESSISSTKTQMYMWYNIDYSGGAVITFTNNKVTMKTQSGL